MCVQQVIAYWQVQPDHIPERIYAGETAEAIHNITHSLSTASASISPEQQASADNCTRVIQEIIEQNNGTFSLPQNYSASNAAALTSLSGNVSDAQQQALAECMKSGNSTSMAIFEQLGPAVFAGLQAFIDTNGYAAAPSICMIFRCTYHCILSWLANTHSPEAVKLKCREAADCAHLHPKTASPAAHKELTACWPCCRPVPIPTLDEFILLSQGLQAAVGQDPSALAALRGARRSFGWNVLGNLLDLGQVAFAPSTPDTLRLADHLSRTHELFRRSA